MNDLPLFPLNTVLLPGIPLYLHIFEERYKQMIRLCVNQRRPFGVVLIRKGSEANGPVAEPFAIGCTAQIVEMQRLGEGRMNIVAVGKDRFRTHSFNHDQPYLMGAVDMLPAVEPTTDDVIEAGQQLLPWISQYVDILGQIRDINFEISELPDDPVMLAYFAAYVLQIPADHKQQFLEASDALALLTDLRAMYRREAAILRTLIAQDSDISAGDTPSFSLN